MPVVSRLLHLDEPEDGIYADGVVPPGADATRVQSLVRGFQRGKARAARREAKEKHSREILERYKAEWKALFEEKIKRLKEMLSGDAARSQEEIIAITLEFANLDAMQREYRQLSTRAFLLQSSPALCKAVLRLLECIASNKPNDFQPTDFPDVFERCEDGADLPDERSCHSGLYLRRAHVTEQQLADFERNWPGAARAFHETRAYLRECQADDQGGYWLYYAGTTHASTPEARAASDADEGKHTLVMNFLRYVLKGQSMEVYKIVTGASDPCDHDRIQWRANPDCQESERILISLFRGIGLNSAPGGFGYPAKLTEEEEAMQKLALELVALEGVRTYSLDETERQRRVTRLQANMSGFHHLKRLMHDNDPSVAKLGGKEKIGILATDEAFEDALDNVARCDFLSAVLAKDIPLEGLTDTSHRMAYTAKTCGPGPQLAQLVSLLIDGTAPLTMWRLFVDLWRDTELHIIIIFVILELLCFLRISEVKTLSIESSRVFGLFDRGIVTKVHDAACSIGLMPLLLDNQFGEETIDKIFQMEALIGAIMLWWDRNGVLYWGNIRVGTVNEFRLRDENGEVVFECVTVATIHPGSVKYDQDVSLPRFRAFYYCRVTLKIVEELAARGHDPEQIRVRLAKIKTESRLAQLENDNRKKLTELTEAFGRLRQLHPRGNGAEEAEEEQEVSDLVELSNHLVGQLEEGDDGEDVLYDAEIDAESSDAERNKQDRSERMRARVYTALANHPKAVGEPLSEERRAWCREHIIVGRTELGAQRAPCPRRIAFNTEQHFQWALTQPRKGANLVRSAQGTMSRLHHLIESQPRRSPVAPSSGETRGEGAMEMEGGLHTMVRNSTYRDMPNGWRYDEQDSKKHPAGSAPSAPPNSDSVMPLKVIVLPASPGEAHDTVLLAPSDPLYRIANCNACSKLTMGPADHRHCRAGLPLSKSQPNAHVQVQCDHQILHALGISADEYMDLSRKDLQPDDYEVLPVAPILRDSPLWTTYRRQTKVTWQGGFETANFEALPGVFAEGRAIFRRDATVHERQISALFWTIVHRDPKYAWTDGQLAAADTNYCHAKNIVEVMGVAEPGRTVVEITCAGRNGGNLCGRHCYKRIKEEDLDKVRNDGKLNTSKRLYCQHQPVTRSSEKNLHPTLGPLGTPELIVHQRPPLPQGVRSWRRLGATDPALWPAIEGHFDTAAVRKVQRWRTTRLAELQTLRDNPNTALPVAEPFFNRETVNDPKPTMCTFSYVHRVIDGLDDLCPQMALATIIHQQRATSFPSRPVFLYGVQCDFDDATIVPRQPPWRPEDARNVRHRERRASRDLASLLQPHLDDLVRILRVDRLEDGTEVMGCTSPYLRLAFLVERGMFTAQERYDLRENNADDRLTLAELAVWMRRHRSLLLSRRDALIAQGGVKREDAYTDTPFEADAELQLALEQALVEITEEGTKTPQPPLPRPRAVASTSPAARAVTSTSPAASRAPLAPSTLRTTQVQIRPLPSAQSAPRRAGSKLTGAPILLPNVRYANGWQPPPELCRPEGRERVEDSPTTSASWRQSASARGLASAPPRSSTSRPPAMRRGRSSTASRSAAGQQAAHASTPAASTGPSSRKRPLNSGEPSSAAPSSSDVGPVTKAKRARAAPIVTSASDNARPPKPAGKRKSDATHGTSGPSKKRVTSKRASIPATPPRAPKTLAVRIAPFRPYARRDPFVSKLDYAEMLCAAHYAGEDTSIGAQKIMSSICGYGGYLLEDADKILSLARNAPVPATELRSFLHPKLWPCELERISASTPRPSSLTIGTLCLPSRKRLSTKWKGSLDHGLPRHSTMST